MPQQLKKVIRKAIRLDPNNRFDTASAFMTKLHALRPNIPDWKIINGFPTLFGGRRNYRIVQTSIKDQYRVEKKVFAGWRADRTFQPGPLEQIVQTIVKK